MPRRPIAPPSRIPRDVARHLGHYVYLYVHPGTDEVLYVGKGHGSRVLAHLGSRGVGKKARVLARLRAAGVAVKLEILAHGLRDGEEAFRVEAAAIDLLGLDRLTNEVRGWRSVQSGRMPLQDLAAYYAAPPVTVTHPALLVRINRLYRHGMGPDELYEATRGVWRLSERRAGAALALAVFEGVVREVYAIRAWHDAGATPYRFRPQRELRVPGRVEFTGAVAAPSVRSRYLGHSVEAYFHKGQRSPVAYVRC